MSAILNNVLKPRGFDSNEFSGSLRPDQGRKNKCPQGSEKHGLVTTSLAGLEAVPQFSSGDPGFLLGPSPQSTASFT